MRLPVSKVFLMRYRFHSFVPFNANFFVCAYSLLYWPVFFVLLYPHKKTVWMRPFANIHLYRRLIY